MMKLFFKILPIVIKIMSLEVYMKFPLPDSGKGFKLLKNIMEVFLTNIRSFMRRDTPVLSMQ